MRRTGRGDPQLTLPVVLALATVYVVWGSTYLGIKVAIASFPPLLMAAARFGLAGTILYAVAIRRGDHAADRPTGRHWRSAFLLGGLMLVGGNGAVTVAEEQLDSGIAALLVAMVPLWMAVLARTVFGERLTWLAVVGLALGFGGVAILIDPFGGSIHTGSALLVVAGTVSWAYGSLRSRDADLPTRPLVGTAMQMIAAAILFAALGVVRGELARLDPGAWSLSGVVAVLYLALFGSILAFSAYVWLLRNAPASLVSTYAYVNPVVAVLLGALLLGEPVTPRTVVAGATIVVAVALITRSRQLRGAPRLARPARRAAVGGRS